MRSLREHRRLDADIHWAPQVNAYYARIVAGMLEGVEKTTTQPTRADIGGRLGQNSLEHASVVPAGAAEFVAGPSGRQLHRRIDPIRRPITRTMVDHAPDAVAPRRRRYWR
jgi:hypothetical protein